MHTETEAIWCCSALLERLIVNGEPAGTRTQGPRLKRAMLYRLSYRLTERRARSLPPTLSLCLARSKFIAYLAGGIF